MGGHIYKTCHTHGSCLAGFSLALVDTGWTTSHLVSTNRWVKIEVLYCRQFLVRKSIFCSVEHCSGKKGLSCGVWMWHCSSTVLTRALSLYGALFPGPAFCCLQSLAVWKSRGLVYPKFGLGILFCMNCSFLARQLDICIQHCYTHSTKLIPKPVVSMWLFILGMWLVYIHSLFAIMQRITL